MHALCMNCFCRVLIEFYIQGMLKIAYCTKVLVHELLF